MKKSKKFKKRLASFGKRFVNLDWANKDFIEKILQDIIDVIYSIFSVKKSSRHETFLEAKQRLQLTDADIQKKYKTCLFLAYFFYVSSVLVLCYTIVCILNGNILQGIGMTGVFMALLGFTFKYHFWYFQLKTKRLGLSLGEWWQYAILDKRAKSKQVVKK